MWQLCFITYNTICTVWLWKDKSYTMSNVWSSLWYWRITTRGSCRFIWGLRWSDQSRTIYSPLSGSAATIRHENTVSTDDTNIFFSPSAEKRQNFTNEKLYLRIPTSVDAIIFTMQNGKYDAVLLTKIVLIDLTIYVLPLRKLKSHYICQE